MLCAEFGVQISDLLDFLVASFVSLLHTKTNLAVTFNLDGLPVANAGVAPSVDRRVDFSTPLLSKL